MAHYETFEREWDAVQAAARHRGLGEAALLELLAERERVWDKAWPDLWHQAPLRWLVGAPLQCEIRLVRGEWTLRYLDYDPGQAVYATREEALESLAVYVHRVPGGWAARHDDIREDLERASR